MSRRSCEESAARKLATRMMSVQELRHYLLRRGYESSDVEEVLLQFSEDGYLDDYRYCMEYFRYGFAKNKGRNRIFSELRERGVDSALIQSAFVEYEEEEEVDEYAMARREMEKILRLSDLTLSDPVPDKIRGRIARKLASFGYSNSLIYGILDELKRQY